MRTYADSPPRSRDRRPRPAPERPAPPKNRRPKDPLWARLSIIIGAIVMVIGGGAVVVPKIAAAWLLGDVDRSASIPEELQGKDISGAINVLLLGTDDRPEAGAEGARTDSIVLVHIPAAHDRAFMISLPRDARVNIPPFPATNYVGGTSESTARSRTGPRRPDRDPQCGTGPWT